MKHLYLVALTCLTCSSSFADVCAIALSNNAIDRTDTQKISAIAFQEKEHLCDETYESVEDFQSKAKSSGFNLSYAGFGIGSSGGKATASGRLSFSSEKFCTASQSDFRSYMSLDQTKSMAGAALKAWTRCIEATQQNDVYLEYEPNRNFDGMSGKIIRRLGGKGPTKLYITDMKVTPNTALISCDVEGVTIKPGSLKSANRPDGLELDTTEETIACTKTSSDSVKVAFGTTVSDVGFADLPSKEVVRVEKITVLDQRLSALQSDLVDLSERTKHAIGSGLSVAIGGLQTGPVDSEFAVNNVFHNTLLEENPSSSLVTIPVSGTYIGTSTVYACAAGATRYVTANLHLDGIGVAGTSNDAGECGSAVASTTFVAKKGQVLKGTCSIQHPGLAGTCYLSVTLLRVD